MKNSSKEKILGITINNKLKFKCHVKACVKSFAKGRGFVTFNKLLKRF